MILFQVFYKVTTVKKILSFKTSMLFHFSNAYDQFEYKRHWSFNRHSRQYSYTYNSLHSNITNVKMSQMVLKKSNAECIRANFTTSANRINPIASSRSFVGFRRNIGMLVVTKLWMSIHTECTHLKLLNLISNIFIALVGRPKKTKLQIRVTLLHTFTITGTTSSFSLIAWKLNKRIMI